MINTIVNSICNNWEHDAFTDYNRDTVKYKDVNEKMVMLHHLFKESNIKRGDKIALIGRNNFNWAITYLASITYGTSIVPILSDFSTNDIHHIINNSDSKLLFCTDNIFDKIDDNKLKKIKGVISLKDFTILCDSNNKISKAHKKANEFVLNREIKTEDLIIGKISEEDVAVLSYTSGTSGFSKGVMIPYRSIYSNVRISIDYIDLRPQEKVVSFLPLAHVFGCLFEFLSEFSNGCHIIFLSRVPTPQIITKAFREIKPTLVCLVPLIMEKIYKRRILPSLESKKIKFMLKVPGLEKIIYKKIREKLIDTFGGNFQEVIIGGASLNPEVEDFLDKINFPYSVGYGMTECGPLISYSPTSTYKAKTCGKVVERMQVRIDSSDPYSIAGEIQVKGDNVMLGYYKNKEATDETFTDDKWLRTGDLGLLDCDDNIVIKGRSKSMILGPSGQNIYPEEIEAKLNNIEFILESLVTEDSNNKLVAMVYPDYEFCDSKNYSKKDILGAIQDNIALLNKELPAYLKISQTEVRAEEFKKTPKRNIKRYLYSNLYRK